MENPPDQHHEHRERDHLRCTLTHLLHSPCNFFDQLFKAFVKCLGHDDHQNDDHNRCTTSTAHKAQDDDVSPVDRKNTEEYDEVVQGRRALSPSISTMVLRKRPPPSPISSGPGGGQINSLY